MDHMNLEPNHGTKKMKTKTRTMRYGALLTTLLALGLASCAEPGGLIDRTQSNLVDKSIFEGEWWYMRTVVDLADDAAWAIEQAGAGAPWPGAMSNYDLASRSGVAGRIRWVIDQNYLYAYRTNEIVVGAALNTGDPNYRGEPLAIFPIEDHVDVRRSYSAATGEPTNVLMESQDRRWYDRQYMRVDWSKNLVTWGLFGAGLNLDGLFGQFQREPVANFVQEGGDSRIPDSWRPTFVRVGDDSDYRLADEWPADQADTIHYMSFVTNELWTPMECYDTSCNTSLRLSLRHAFLRIPPNHEYAVETLPNSEYDRFGIIRTEQRTYIRGGADSSTLGTYCDSRCVASCDVLTCTNDSDCGDGGTCRSGECRAGTYANTDQCGAGGQCAMQFDEGWGQAFGSCSAGTLEDADDCGAGIMCDYSTHQCAQPVDADCGPGACDSTTHTCQGGLTPDYGETDFLTYYRQRHNLYSDSLTDTQCLSDWQCDGRHGGDGQAGSRCDLAAHRCTIPISDRPLRPAYYTLSPHFPKRLVRSAFEVVSQWNETFMHGNRAVHGRAQPQGQRIACQSVNPTDYCFCGDSATAPEVSADDMTCPYRENFFVPPEMRQNVTDPYNCWIATIGDDGQPAVESDAINPQHPTSRDEYTQDVYRYAFVGDECLFKLKVNSCDVPVADGQAPAACEELGDIRYQFFNYVSAAGSGWCGVMQQVADPMNGEAISIPINAGGTCLDSVATNAVTLWPVLRGEEPEDWMFSGENIRGYFSNLGNVHNPVGLAPALDGSANAPQGAGRPALPINPLPGLTTRIENVSARIQTLQGEQGRASIFSDRVQQLQGTPLEARLVEGLGAGAGTTAIENGNILTAMQLNQQLGSHPSNSQLVQQISPFRQSFRDLMMTDRMREAALLDNYIYYPRDTLYTSRYNHYWAEAFRGRPLPEAQIRWEQGFMVAVMLHEMGHGMGLEHNFAGSYDRDNYHDGYFDLVTQQDSGTGRFRYALPRMSEYDCGRDGLCPGATGYPGPDPTEGDGVLTGNETNAWEAGLRAVRTARADLGIGNYMTSSIMDYPGDYSDMSGLGRYDKAAVYFNYFNMVEAYEGNPEFSDGRGSSLEGLLRSDTTPRQLWSYYRGGESCEADTDCPFAAGSSALSSGQPLHQRCVRNPRYSNVPQACGGDRNCICSNFDEDMVDLQENAYPGFGNTPYTQVDYLFCSNPRLNDISWCNVFDAGETFRETIDHWRQEWQEGYPRNYFRNYRRHFHSGSRAMRYIVDAAKIYQHLFYRYYYEPSFRAQTGPLGLQDQMMASVDAMNWMAELAQLPDVGSYQSQLIDGPITCDPSNPDAPGNSPDCQYGYALMDNDHQLEAPGSDFTLQPGEGFYTWSRYQDGLYGFFRMDRAGVFWDKLVALQALTIRDWGLSFTLDARYFINFYDLFPIEMTELFGGFVSNNPTWMAPRIRMDSSGNPQVYYLNYLLTNPLGQCRDATTGALSTCDEPVAQRYPDRPLLGTSDDILRVYAAVFSLAEFPVFYDPSFEQKLSVYKLDSASGFTIPDVQQDNQPTCAFGEAIPGSGHALCTDPTEADYIVYVSDRLHTPYVAVKVRQRLTYNLEEEQVGFQLLLRLYHLQERVRALTALRPLSAVQSEELAIIQRELQDGETFLETLMEIERYLGLSSWL